jgi:acetyl esterase/lipase
MSFRVVVRWLFRAFLAATVALALLAGLGWWYLTPAARALPDEIYGDRNGKPLTLIIRQPEQPNGLGVLVMLSGKWKSRPEQFRPWLVAPLLRQGFTVFGVAHISQPEASVQETVADVSRAVRYVRHHAGRFGVDPARLGVTGGSSGGHLSLMLATSGGPGDPGAADPVDREDASVQAVAVFFPVTDLLNLGASTENDGTGGPPLHFKKSFGPGAEDIPQWRAVIGRDISPIERLGPRLPPVLIAHGDADTLVPIDQSRRFRQRAAEFGHEVTLITRPGARHGWLTMLWDLRHFGQWLLRELRVNPAIAG